MAYYLKVHAPVLAIILSLFVSVQARADNRVVVVPMFGPDAEILRKDQGLPATLAPSGSSYILDEFTSTRSGYWMVTQTLGEVNASCPSSTGAYFFIGIDGEPIRSSTIYSEAEKIFSPVFTGISENIIPAGYHTITYSVMCLSGDLSGFGYNVSGTTTIVVMP